MVLWAPLFMLLDTLRLRPQANAEPVAMRRRQLKNAARGGRCSSAPRGDRVRGGAARARRPGGWYFRLQVLEHAEYATRSEANRIKPRPVVPGRGLIYDRKGRMLADNVPAYRLDVVPDQAGDMHATGRATVEDRRARRPKTSQHFNADRKAMRGFRPVTLKLRVSEEEAARFAVDRWRFPGVDLVPYLSRRYPYGDAVRARDRLRRPHRRCRPGEARRDQYRASPTPARPGSSAITRTRCAARIGYEQVETNVEGRALRTRRPRARGARARTCSLSIDLDLQQAAATAFGDLDGSAVAVDPRTGEILAMVSLPSFDPNLFVNGISPRRLQHADGQSVAPAVQPQRRRRRPARIDDQAVPRPGRARQRPAHAARTRCSRPANSTSRGSARLSRRARRRRLDRPEQVDRAVGELLLLQARATTWASTASTSACASTVSARPTGIDLMGESMGIVPSPRMEGQAQQGAVVSPARRSSPASARATGR